MTTKRFYTTLLLFTFCFASSTVYAADGKALLMEMATTLAQARQFTVTISAKYDAVQKTGEKIEYSEQRKVTIQRPNHLRVEAQQSDGDKSCLIFDGKTITLFSKTENVYSLTNHPGNIDEAVLYAGGRMGIRIPLARMLVTSLPQELEKMVSEVEYVEKNILGAPLNHIAVRSDDVDMQLWIGADKLPRRVVLTYKNAPGQPQFRADFSDWNPAPKVTPKTFTFTPPKNAEKILTLLPQARLKVKNPAGKGGRK